MVKTVLVTGAGGGIGHALAEQLLARGDAVIAAARRLQDVAALQALGATPLVMDVADGGSVKAAFAEIDRLGISLDAVVHGAASAPLGTVEFTAPEVVGALVNVNTLGALRVLQASLPRLRAAESGRLILISSLWGRVSGPFVSSYAASKHAVEALADSARRETRGQGVHISVVEPGVVLTPMYENQVGQIDARTAEISDEERRLYGALYADHRKLVASAGKTAITADQCARVILTCLDARKPKPRYRAGTDAKLLVALGRLLSDRALDFVFSQSYRG